MAYKQEDWIFWLVTVTIRENVSKRDGWKNNICKLHFFEVTIWHEETWSDGKGVVKVDAEKMLKASSLSGLSNFGVESTFSSINKAILKMFNETHGSVWLRSPSVSTQNQQKWNLPMALFFFHLALLSLFLLVYLSAFNSFCKLSRILRKTDVNSNSNGLFGWSLCSCCCYRG